ncbi:hypothetical protein SEA_NOTHINGSPECIAL_34 [Mycobacterium phage NothingSpecial]|nr:hypothetical protein SEA_NOTHINGSPECIAL_34 [Mycobacterium phage NothingSpecial]
MDLVIPQLPDALKAYVLDYERVRKVNGDTTTALLLADSIVAELRELGFPDLPPI